MFVLTFVHSFLLSFIRSFVRAFVHSFVRLSVSWFVNSFTPVFVLTFVHLFLLSFIRSFVRVFVYSFVSSFFCSFIRYFIRPFIVFFSSFVRFFCLEREKFQKCSLSVFLTCFTSRQLFTLVKILNPLLNAPDIKTNSWFFREKEIKHLLLTCMPIKYYLCRIYETLSITYLGWTDLHAEN